MGIGKGHAHPGQSFEARGMNLSGIPTKRTGPVIHVINRDKKNAGFRRRLGARRQEEKKQGESDHWGIHSFICKRRVGHNPFCYPSHFPLTRLSLLTNLIQSDDLALLFLLFDEEYYWNHCTFPSHILYIFTNIKT